MILNRKVLKVAGSDRAKFLGDLLTIAVSEDMEICYGALLSAQGKIISDLFIWAEEGALFLDLPESQYAAVKAKLMMYKLRADVELVDLSIEVRQAMTGIADPRHADLGYRFYDAFSGEDMSAEDYVARRVRNLIPEFDVDFGTNEAYPIEWRFHEMGGIDYKKGCYIGQEIAARMRHKTVLQKSIVAATIEGDTSGETQVLNGEKAVGKLLTVSGDQAMIFAKLSATSKEMSVGNAKITLND